MVTKIFSEGEYCKEEAIKDAGITVISNMFAEA